MVTNSSSNIKTAASGKVLQGQGVGTANDFSTATFPATATGTGKILRADGTNWVATTATYPDTAGTSGNVLTSDGTNWSSTASSSPAITLVSKTLTSTQIKNLHGTPIELIAAQGSNKMIVLVGEIYAYYKYGGNNAFTAAAAQNIYISYNNGGTEFLNIATTAQLSISTGASSLIYVGNAGVPSWVATSNSINKNIAFYNTSVTEIGGNAANDNQMYFRVAYIVLDVT